jgi:hypothetical protein
MTLLTLLEIKTENFYSRNLLFITGSILVVLSSGQFQYVSLTETKNINSWYIHKQTGKPTLSLSLSLT